MRQLDGIITSITEEDGKRRVLIELCMPSTPTGPYGRNDVLEGLRRLEERKRGGECLTSRELKTIEVGLAAEEKYKKDRENYLQEYPVYNLLHLGKVKIIQEDDDDEP